MLLCLFRGISSAPANRGRQYGLIARLDSFGRERPSEISDCPKFVSTPKESPCPPTSTRVSLEGRQPRALEVTDIVYGLKTSITNGLDAADANARLQSAGPNKLAEARRDPAWKRFLNQFGNVLIVILFVAAIVSFVVSGELKTPAVVLVVVLLNAFIGFIQENRAEASLDALKKDADDNISNPSRWTSHGHPSRTTCSRRHRFD